MKKVGNLIFQTNYNILKYTKYNNKTFSTTQEYKITDSEKEWNNIYKSKLNAQKEYLNSQLNEYEKKEVKVLSDRVSNLNRDERLYYIQLLKNKTELIMGQSITSFDSTLPSNFITYDNIWPKENPNWCHTQNLISTIDSFSGKASGAGASIAGSTKSDKKEEAKPIEEKKAEKSQYDIKLASFDPAKKIALIKEVRGWLNLGLKEAKDLVEKAPTDLKKGVKKEDAEEIKKKLGEIGAVIELV